MRQGPKNRDFDVRSETGEMPAVPDERREPPMPPTLPEFEEPGSTTGLVRVVPESEDKTRDDDDSADAKDVAPGGKP